MTDSLNSDPGLIGLLRLLLRRRRLIVGVALGFGLLGFLLAKFMRTWSAEATIRPQSSNAQVSRLSGLAAQFGFTLPGAPLGDPVRFYSELLQSREVLDQVVRTPLVVAVKRGSRDSLRGTFLDLYKVKGTDSADRVWRGRDRLKGLMTVTSDREAGFVRMRLVTRYPDLSLQLAQRILTLTNESSLRKQRRQAEAERSFIEGRMKDARDTLEDAENTLERFLTANRQYQNSPLLNLQYGRLQRRVDLRQQVFAGLSQAYEQARIDEVRDTPVLMVVDGVEGSLRTGKRASRDGIMWALVGGGLALLLVLGLDGWERFKRQGGEAVRPFLEDLGRAWPLNWVMRRRSE